MNDSEKKQAMAEAETMRRQLCSISYLIGAKDWVVSRTPEGFTKLSFKVKSAKSKKITHIIMIYSTRSDSYDFNFMEIRKRPMPKNWQTDHEALAKYSNNPVIIRLIESYFDVLVSEMHGLILETLGLSLFGKKVQV